MRNKISASFIVVAVALVLVASIAVSASASPEEPASVSSRTYYLETLTDTYKRVWRPSGNNTIAPINGYITIRVTEPSRFTHTDIRMLDRNGNVIWEEFGAIPNNSVRTFYCGPNVYYVEARIGAINVLGLPYRHGQSKTWSS